MKSIVKKLAIVFGCIVALTIALLYIEVRPPSAPRFAEIDCASVADWNAFPAEVANWQEPDRKLFYLVEPEPAYTSDIRHFVLKTDMQAKIRCFDLKNYSETETPTERYGNDLVIYTKYHERSAWSAAQVNRLSWWDRNFSGETLGESRPVSPSPEMQAATIGKPAGVYEWKDGDLHWVTALGSPSNLSDVIFHSSLFDVIDHNGTYFVSRPGMGALTVIDLRSVGKS